VDLAYWFDYEVAKKMIKVSPVNYNVLELRSNGSSFILRISLLIVRLMHMETSYKLWDLLEHQM